MTERDFSQIQHQLDEVMVKAEECQRNQASTRTADGNETLTG